MSFLADNFPLHVGIVMDGNGRWARLRGLPRVSGHTEGVKVTKRMISAVVARGIPFLSLYVFSTENWGRSKAEVNALMALLVKHLEGELPFYREHQIRLWHSGRRDRIPFAVSQALDHVVAETANHAGLTVNLLIDYGGHDEICRAVNRWSELGQRHCSPEQLTAFLDGGLQLPAVDLLIRSGGEQRLSNFLLWRCAYSEFYFSEVLWPDWDAAELDRALEQFCTRQRRYGREE